jgi:hypothetical protein
LRAVRKNFGDVLTPDQLRTIRIAMERLIERHSPQPSS